MNDLLAPLGFPEISIIAVLSVAIVILITLNLVFILWRTKKKKKKSFKALPKEEPWALYADPFAEMPAPQYIPPRDYRREAEEPKRSRGPVILPPIVLPPPDIRMVSRAYGKSAGGEGQSRGPVVLPPIMLPPPTVRVAPPVMLDPRAPMANTQPSGNAPMPPADPHHPQE